MLDLKECVCAKEVQGLVLLQGNAEIWSRVSGQWKYSLSPGLSAMQKSDTGTMHIQKPHVYLWLFMILYALAINPKIPCFLILV